MGSDFQEGAPKVKSLRRLLTQDSGAVMVEYVVILGTVSLGVAVAVAVFGGQVVEAFERTRSLMYLPFP